MSTCPSIVQGPRLSRKVSMRVNLGGACLAAGLIPVPVERDRMMTSIVVASELWFWVTLPRSIQPGIVVNIASWFTKVATLPV
jgi:hypothetical protein